MDSGLLRQQDLEERFQEGLPAFSGVVHELEERKVKREQFLRDPAVWTQPGAKQGPEAFDRVDVDFVEAIPVIISGVLAFGVADSLMPVPPRHESGINVVLVCIDQATTFDDSSDERFDRCLLDVFEHPDEHLARALQDAEDWRLFFFQSTSARGCFQPPPAGLAPFFSTAAG